MKMLKKAVSLLLVGVITVTSLFCGAVTASAEVTSKYGLAEVDGYKEGYAVAITGITQQDVNNAASYVDLSLKAGITATFYGSLSFKSGGHSYSFVSLYMTNTKQYLTLLLKDDGFYLDSGKGLASLYTTAGDGVWNLLFFVPNTQPDALKLIKGITDAEARFGICANNDLGKGVYGSDGEKITSQKVTLVKAADSSDSSNKSSGSISVYRELDGDKLVIYIDGLNRDYFDKFLKKYSLGTSETDCYYVSITFGTYKDSQRYSASFLPDCPDCSRIDTVQDTLLTDMNTKKESGSKNDITYYDKNDGTLTSGYRITISDKTAAKAIGKMESLGSIYISVWSDSDAADDADEFLSYSDNDLKFKDYGASSSGEENASPITVKNPSDQTYTGKALKPDVKITYNGKTLKKGTDYTLSYKNNKKIGTATVTIKGKGKYNFTATTKFDIVPKKTKLTVKKSDGKYGLSWKKVKGADTYQVDYSSDGGKTFTRLANVPALSTSALFKDLDSSKTYVFRIRAVKTVNGSEYQGKWSKKVKA